MSSSIFELCRRSQFSSRFTQCNQRRVNICGEHWIIILSSTVFKSKISCVRNASKENASNDLEAGEKKTHCRRNWRTCQFHQPVNFGKPQYFASRRTSLENRIFFAIAWKANTKHKNTIKSKKIGRVQFKANPGMTLPVLRFHTISTELIDEGISIFQKFHAEETDTRRNDERFQTSNRWIAFYVLFLLVSRKGAIVHVAHDLNCVY